MRNAWPVIAIAWALAGCASPGPPLAFDVKDGAAYDADLATCRTYAAAARPRLSASSVGVAGGRSGLQNSAGAAINPAVPAIAALGGAASEALNELNLAGESERRLVVRCMERKGDKSGAYFILDPGD